MKKEKLEEYDKILFDVAAQSSRLERRAEEAEREVEKLKKCQYMSKRIGNEYEGVISGVTEWGLYVELPNTVEGLVHISKLDGYYIYDEENYELKPDRGGKTYALGQTVNVIVDSVDEALRTIDFVIKD